MSLTLAISECFALLEAVVPNFPEPARKAKAMQVWKLVLESDGVTPSELKEAVTEYLRTGKFMPAPSEILELVSKTNPCSLITDPVKTGEHMGVDEIGSRARCEALGLPFVDLREDAPPELPSPESRAAAQERAEALLARAEAFHVKHSKPARERAGFDGSPDPEAEARKAAMLERLRGSA